jgi:hypothetical protein
MLPTRDESGYQQTSIMVSDSASETEEEILFQTKKEGKNGTLPQAGVQIKTNHRLTPNGPSNHSGT